MPHSDEALRPWIAGQLRTSCDLPSVETVVDVGAGAGGWREFMRPHVPDARWTAIEIWRPYIAMFSLRERYDQVIHGDVRRVTLPPADLYIFGDVLEHMPAADAVRVWGKARKAARWLVINLPVTRYEQDAIMGNPYEAHVCHWDMPSVLESFPGIIFSHENVPGSTVGAFIAEGEEKPS